MFKPIKPPLNAKNDQVNDAKLCITKYIKKEKGYTIKVERVYYNIKNMCKY